MPHDLQVHMCVHVQLSHDFVRKYIHTYASPYVRAHIFRTVRTKDTHRHTETHINRREKRAREREWEWHIQSCHKLLNFLCSCLRFRHRKSWQKQYLLSGLASPHRLTHARKNEPAAVRTWYTEPLSSENHSCIASSVAKFWLVRSVLPPNCRCQISVNQEPSNELSKANYGNCWGEQNFPPTGMKNMTPCVHSFPARYVLVHVRAGLGPLLILISCNCTDAVDHTLWKRGCTWENKPEKRTPQVF